MSVWQTFLAKILRRFNSTNNTAHTSNLWPHMTPLVVGSTWLAPSSPCVCSKLNTRTKNSHRHPPPPRAVLQLPLSPSTGS